MGAVQIMEGFASSNEPDNKHWQYAISYGTIREIISHIHALRKRCTRYKSLVKSQANSIRFNHDVQRCMAHEHNHTRDRLGSRIRELESQLRIETSERLQAEGHAESAQMRVDTLTTRIRELEAEVERLSAGQRIQCVRCYGEGQIVGHRAQIERCPDCHGTGAVFADDTSAGGGE